MSREIFVNLPVKDLDASITFFTQLGFEFNPAFTNEKATCMIVGDGIFVMLLVRDFFQTFTRKPVAEAANGTEVILALSADSREEVDEMVAKALAAGGAESNPASEQPGMYGGSFQDPDGHLWEVIYMDPAALGS
ncbi:VOC family protein [Paenarthrobacter sp. DKR-5]|uniref:VOC family protein n=1 Tax=Paenarthrobacter sp. DKR-5 TaxID=2835535 RepID=UPI001BDD3411|nr:VOC family protein [Paenarthrobacter sp. DKR-5]MBT1004105.1 VOC family protein [Paenarthrobacter sp. DKR-5]